MPALGGGSAAPHEALPLSVGDRDLLPLAALVSQQASVASGRNRAQLALELAVARQPARVQRAVGKRRLDGAAGLRAVLAIWKPALKRQLRDLLEEGLQRGLV